VEISLGLRYAFSLEGLPRYGDSMLKIAIIDTVAQAHRYLCAVIIVVVMINLVLSASL